ncbi:transposable element Tc1 transposase [Trichonephila clavipes]|nr:transposable element Tc1 transposase [Trichonephila clavipes]
MRKIIRSVKKNPLLSAPKLASSISSEIAKKISVETVRRVLHNAGFHGHTPVRKPLINCVDRKKRLSFAKEHISKPESFWNTAIFFDESKFNPYRSDGQYKVWRQVWKELNPKNTIKTVLEQDNDPKHTAKIVKLYLLYHCKKELHTSPQSPDLNVIENLWSQLEKSVQEHAITSKEDLKNVLKEEWTKITVETTIKLVESMPKRLQAVNKAKGFATKY